MMQAFGIKKYSSEGEIMTLLLFNVAACVLPLNSLLLPRLLVQLEERAFMFF